MGPEETAEVLRHIASEVSASPCPDPSRVEGQLRRVLTAVEGKGTKSRDEVKGMLSAQLRAFDINKDDFVRDPDAERLGSWIGQRSAEIRSMLSANGIHDFHDLTGSADLEPPEHEGHVKYVFEMLFTDGGQQVNVDTMDYTTDAVGPEHQDQELHSFVDSVMDQAYAILGEMGERLPEESISPFFPDAYAYDLAWDGSDGYVRDPFG